MALAADLRVGEAEPRAEPERVREEQEQQHRRGQQECEPEHVPIVERAGEGGGLRRHATQQCVNLAKRRPREGGDPGSFAAKPLGPRLRGDDDIFESEGQTL